jgi:hypothetical protein
MREFIDFNPKYCILKGNLEITVSGRKSWKVGLQGTNLGDIAHYYHDC